MANALLRERINDVAGEVVRVAHALEGLGSPIDTMLAGKVAELGGATIRPNLPRRRIQRHARPPHPLLAEAGGAGVILRRTLGRAERVSRT